MGDRLNNPRYYRMISIFNRVSISEENIRARFRPFHMGIGRVKSHFRGSFLWVTDRNTLYDKPLNYFFMALLSSRGKSESPFVIYVFQHSLIMSNPVISNLF